MRFVLAVFFSLLFACGGGNKESTVPGSVADVDSDPIVLLPSSPLGIATLDARVLADDKNLGKPIAAIADKWIPLGQESSFVPSRDVDRITVGSYALEGVDFAGVVTGKFDVEKITTAVKNHTPMKSGGPIVETPYADHSIYTVADTGFVVLSSKTVIIGTDTALRRSLDRLKSGNLKRDMQPWIYETLETKGAAFAIAGDLAGKNLQNYSLGPVSLAFTKGLGPVRVVGNFANGNINVAGTASWDNPENAKTGAEAIAGLAKMSTPFVALGIVPQIQNLKVEPVNNDVQVTFTLDGGQVANVLGKLSQYL